ncbi:transcription elongation factor GreA [Salinisphaera sp. Q1T1-3]|uniref:transcription elongation factor GreA n=1 Tax=Salinisphaera sp. Q1T1-3 TaxID=2321229 RepID=UPI000E70EA4D|nr:transcription elongation factor GreA [Salinisphaera sp. Q1T1-3]RJS92720.1 transcription elongation factor GreA [Salinisphaera sp. Q1T1-3]
MDRTPLTQTGADALRAELNRRKKTERPRIVDAIEEARAHGDLKENAEYHAAKEEQGFNEGRIAEIEAKLGSAQVIDVAQVGAQANGRVVFGATVDLADEDSGDELTYQIVGEDEADIKQGKLSFASPIARALIGKSAGDVVDVDVPGGKRTLEIVEVRYV